MTESDLHRAADNRQKFSDTVERVVSREVASLQVHQTIRNALRVFYMNEVKQAPVLNLDGRPVGILHYLDVVLARIQST